MLPRGLSEAGGSDSHARYSESSGKGWEQWARPVGGTAASRFLRQTVMCTMEESVGLCHGIGPSITGL